jgi:hypothetical protein
MHPAVARRVHFIVDRCGEAAMSARAKYFRIRVGGRKKSRVKVRPVVFIFFLTVALTMGTIAILMNLQLEDRIAAWNARHPTPAQGTPRRPLEDPDE